MYPYKVVHLACPFIKKKKVLAMHNEGMVDGYTLSRELEALILEEHKQGFEVFDITPIASNVEKFGHSLSVTKSLMVTFKFVSSK